MATHREIGIYSYLSFSPGVGGKLKKEVDDFFVEEIPISIPKNKNGKNLILKVKLRNWETNRFVKLLSKKLGISRNRIRFAGTKDKRSVSVQYFCVLNFSKEIDAKLGGMEILGSFRTDYCLKLGDLLGNNFSIILKDAKCDTRIEKIEQELNGKFPNFFGVQRFGASRPISHIVGKMIVHGDFENAVRYYIGYPGEFEEDPGRKVFFDTMDPREAIKEISLRAEYERAMLNHLITHPGDFKGAFKALPRNLLIMFVHAYQSYLFNMMVSERLKIGTDIRIGDVVLKTDQYGRPIQEYVKVNEFNISKIKKLAEVGKAYLSTVLLGYETKFSEGIQGEIERRIAGEEGVKKDMFRIRDIPEISSKGLRRPVITRFKNYHRDGCNFRFTLLPGCYATSLMREFMKLEELHWY